MILLVVLGVLVIFALAVLMFVISSRQHKQTAQSHQKVERYDVHFVKQLDYALLEALRGSHNRFSSLAPHGLLEDIYGNDSLPAATTDPPLLVTAAAPINATSGAASGLVLITVTDPAPTPRLNQAPGYYNGRVVTTLDGPSRMQSTRIIGYQFAGGVGRFQIVAFENGLLPQVNDRVLINGREFTGVGSGYDPNPLMPDGVTPNPNYGTTRIYDPDYPAMPAALLPNTAADVKSRLVDLKAGGANPGYTAADYNHMALAGRSWIPASPNGAGWTFADRNGNNTTIPEQLCGRWVVLLPSFHRPDLVNWMVHNAPNPSDKNLWRKHTLRPLSDVQLHPGFNRDTIGHTNFLMNPDLNNNGIPDVLETDVNGNGIPDILEGGGLLWDVDNDGDGLVDSVWVDLGLPPQAGPDGRLFKPLFAFLILDMDNRLNLNVVGNPQQALQDPGPQATTAQPGMNFPQGSLAASYLAAGANPANPGAGFVLPQGRGNSPARVNPRVIFSKAEWSQILNGVGPVSESPGVGAEGAKNGRYGERDLAPNPALAGLTDGLRDPGNIVKDPQYYNGYGLVDQTAPFGRPIIDLMASTAGYGYPVDYAERSLFFLDAHGSPVRLNFGPSYPLEIEHPLQLNPYRERNTFRKGQKIAIDAPFTMADVEELLRRYDVDAQSLHRRLSRLSVEVGNAGSGRTDPNLSSLWANTASARRAQGLIAAESYDLPVGAFVGTKQIRDTMLAQTPPIKPTGNSIMDLVAYKIISESTIANGGTTPGNIQTIIANSLPQLLPPELIRGERMNVNRAWGNGRDDTPNGNLGFGTIDEPGEANPNNNPSPNTLSSNNFESIWWEQGAAPTTPADYSQFAGVPMNYANGLDLNGDGKYDATDEQIARGLYDSTGIRFQALARQLYARQLYVLMMLVTDRGYTIPNTGAGAAGSLAARRYTAQRVAQWAVNVVDYLDPDSISTPFEFDYEPFVDNAGTGTTWNVDGWIKTNPVTGQASADDQFQFDYTNPAAGSYRGVVWGCERPLLLLTETFACHDIRTADLPDDTSGKKNHVINDATNPDPDFDNKRRPQGSAFLELYNPSSEPVPAEYRSLTLGINRNGIDLSRLAPLSADGNPRPVWQLVLRREIPDWTKPDLVYLDPQFPNAYKNPPDPKDERIVWFTSDSAYQAAKAAALPSAVDARIYYTSLQTWKAPTGDPDLLARPDWQGYENRVGFDSTATNMANMCLVAPGGYTVIGSRVKTRFGMTGPLNTQAGSITVLLLDQTAGSPQPPANNATNGNAAGRLVADTPAVTYPDWGARGGNQTIKPPAGIVINYPRPLSITEPGPGETYYQAPDDLTVDPDDATIKYRDAYKTAIDTPLDTTNPSFIKSPAVTVYLQRLANPLLAWDPDTNPYLTVDAMPMNATKFNGESAAADPSNKLVLDNPVYFSSRERIGENGDLNVWKQVFSDPTKDPAVPGPGRPPSKFAHSFGFVSGFTNGGGQANRYLAAGGVWDSTSFGAGSQYIGDPKDANGRVFPWFTWNDHPVASHLELMNVPASSPSRLLYEYRLRPAVFPDQYADRSTNYDGLSPPNGPASGPPYGHLLNFFQSSSAAADAGGGWNVAGTAAGNLFRVFELLRVPSRFDGTDVIFNPTQFVNPLQDPSGGTMQHSFYPPFNRISRYRDPGLININTIGDDGLMWQAILDNDDNNTTPPRNQVHWRKVFASRQGYGGVIPTNQPLLPLLNNDSPTMFANPFRSYSDSYNVPIPALRNQQASAANTATPRSLVEATLLRADPLDPRIPLLATQTFLDDTLAGANSLGAGDTRAPFTDGDRNPYFRYDTLRKLGNVITTRSNVYGVWITVGYFEVLPAYDPNNPTTNMRPRENYPDSYTLGAELGSDTGEVVRHRMFSVIDRSIPVAFQRGEDYNSQKAVVIKKVIE